MKWEHRVTKLNLVEMNARGGKLEAALDAAGDEGFELVAIHNQPPELKLIFKRPRQEKAKAAA